MNNTGSEDTLMQTMYHAFGTGDRGARPYDVQTTVLDEPFPEAELTDSIAHVEVTDHGDCPRQYFISVHGTDKAKVIAMWRRAYFVMMEVNWWDEG